MNLDNVPPGERAARIAWARLVEPCDGVAAKLVRSVGAEEALFGLDPHSGFGKRLAARIESLDVTQDLAIARRLGARIVIPGDEEWPVGLDDLGIPPWCLWVRGEPDLGEEMQRSVSIVGSRACTQYGQRIASDLAAGLAERGFAVVSGAAYGIDGAAHRGALTADGVTVAVLAGGVDRPYPRGHDGLLRSIAETGLVVSEVPPGWAPSPARFIHRNRIIATLTTGTVVVEAGLRSGTSSTARQAREHHRVVCAVPGSVESAASAGCHQLIRDKGALLVTDAAEVAEAVGKIGDDLAEPKRGEVRPSDDLDQVPAAVYDALPVRRGVSVDDLAARCAQEPRAVLAALGLLQQRELARRDETGWRKPAARSSR